MRKLLYAFLFALLFVGASQAALAQGPITVTRADFKNNFPATMTFSLEASSGADIKSAAVIIRLNGLATSSRFPLKFDSAQTISTQFVWDLQSNSGGGYVPPGVNGEYWFHLEDVAGSTLDSPHQTFRLDDVTQKWQKLSSDQVAVYWYAGGNDFGNQLFERAKSAIAFLQQNLSVTVTKQIQILVYGNRNDFFRSSEPGQAEWTGGRTYAEYGVILINIEPSNLDWGLGATSHELTHAVVHAKLSNALADLSMPHWVDEGLAVYNQTTDHSPDVQFEGPIRFAIQANTLMTLRVISGNFPADSNLANLAYGESYSAVAFMFKNYGKDKVAQLLLQFNQGGTYDDSFKAAFGVTMDEFENVWRQSIGAQLRPLSTQATNTPVAIPTFAFSTGDTPVPGANRTPTQVAVASTAVPQRQPTTAPSQPGGTTGLCGGLLPIGGLMLMGWAYSRRKRVKV